MGGGGGGLGKDKWDVERGGTNGEKKGWMVEHVALHSWIIWHTTHPSFHLNGSPARKEEEECVAGEKEKKKKK